jgi:hypothetical protein
MDTGIYWKIEITELKLTKRKTKTDNRHMKQISIRQLNNE